jgi:hypothetical protein
LDRAGDGREVVASDFYAEADEEVAGEVVGFGEELYLVFVEGGAAEVEDQAQAFGDGGEEVAGDEVLLADDDPVLALALLDNEFPEVLDVVAVAEHHLEEGVAAVDEDCADGVQGDFLEFVGGEGVV